MNTVSTASAITAAPAAYDESAIRVLEGLDPVRHLPGMYTRTENPLHIVQEVIDNAADEALAGHGTSIEVTSHADGSISVLDDGRGIPYGLHPTEGVSVVEIVFTQLHAGGKFDKNTYKTSGGLHGVGVSCVNALSTLTHVTVRRDGGTFEQEYVIGVPQYDVRRIGDSRPRSAARP